MPLRAILFLTALAGSLLGCQVGGLTVEEKVALNRQFDALERAYWPRPVDLRGKNVLYLGFRSEHANNGQFHCRDACRHLIDGQNGAQTYFGLTDWPETPNFAQPVDLKALVEGRFAAGDDMFSTALTPLAADVQPPDIDYVLINLRQGITPVLNQILPEYGLKREDGEVWLVLSSVADDRAFQLGPSDARYIEFGRAPRLGIRNSYNGTYNFPYAQIDRNERENAMREMFCAGAC